MCKPRLGEVQAVSYAQRSPTFLAPGVCFVEDSSSTDGAGGSGGVAGDGVRQVELARCSPSAVWSGSWVIKLSEIELSLCPLWPSPCCFDLQECSSVMDLVLPTNAHCCPHFIFGKKKLFPLAQREHPDNTPHFSVWLRSRDKAFPG